MSAPALELRVLSGMHRHASALVTQGTLIGADADCDIVLADPGIPPRVARVHIGADTWMLVPEDGESPGTPRQPNQPVQLGSIWLTLADTDAPWIDAPTPTPAPPLDADLLLETSSPGEASAGPDLETVHDGPAASGLATSTAAGLVASSAAPVQRKNREALYVYGGTVAMLLLSVAGVIFLLQPPPSVPAGADPMRASIEKSLPTIMEILEKQGLTSRLTVGRRPDQTIVISGWLRTAAEQEQLATALSAVWPMPALRVNNEAELVAAALNVLKAYPVRYDASYLGDGVLNIRGISADAAQRAQASDAVRTALPGLKLNMQDVELVDDVSQKFADAAKQAGLEDVQMKWNGEKLEISAPEDPKEIGRLQLVIDTFNAGNFRVATLLPAAPAQPARRAIATTVPFTIRSVMGGAQPFIVVEDGTKLVPGGVYRKYRLVSVENGKVTFDGPTYAVVSR